MTAIVSTSHKTPFGRSFTATQERAGFPVKYFAYTSLNAATIPYGYATDSILVGDWNGNGMDTLCVRRDNEYHFKNSIQSGGADKIILYGRKDDVTYAGKWK